MNFTVKSQCYQAKRIDEASHSAYFDATPKVMYRRYYLEVLDTETERRFESPFMPRWKVFWRNQLLEKKLHIKDIVQHFTEDLGEYELLTELKMVKNMYCANIISYSTFNDKLPSIRAFSHKHQGFFNCYWSCLLLLQQQNDHFLHCGM